MVLINLLRALFVAVLITLWASVARYVGDDPVSLFGVVYVTVVLALIGEDFAENWLVSKFNPPDAPTLRY